MQGREPVGCRRSYGRNALGISLSDREDSRINELVSSPTVYVMGLAEPPKYVNDLLPRTR